MYIKSIAVKTHINLEYAALEALINQIKWVSSKLQSFLEQVFFCICFPGQCLCADFQWRDNNTKRECGTKIKL